MDWLRALAIVMVINCHWASTFAPSGNLAVIQLGGRGVDLFFLLSGWLLGQQLLKELRDTGSIDIRRFWIRRWLRTLPAYYAVLLYTYAWQMFARGNYQLDPSFLYFGQTYLSDMPYFTISWSLCVEEHFYLAVAPLLLLFFRSRPARLLIPVLLLIPTVCRAMGWYDDPDQTHVRWDQCAFGVVLAYVNVFAPAIWLRLVQVRYLLLAVVLGLVSWNVLVRLNRSWEFSDLNTMTWTLIFMVFVFVANSTTYWQSGTYWEPTRYLADRAYALYLLHGDGLMVVKKLGPMPLVLSLVLSWLVACCLAEVLYRWVEAPCMRLRSRIMPQENRKAPLLAVPAVA